jgi:7-cyano-7-deazaguanine synthase
MKKVSMSDKKAIVLSSGGIDSTTAMAIARAEGYALYSLTCNYGQRHACELEAAGKVADYFAVEKHLVIDMDLRGIGGSALTDDIDVPKGRRHDAILSGIPVTYVPARNTIFLSYALAWAEALSAPDIFIGVNAVDYSGYPDCRPEFIAAYERLANLAVKAAVEGQLIVKIKAPLIAMTKAEIIRTGVRMGVDYSLTHSCYDPPETGTACGLCDSCHLRRKGFREAGVTDPAHYAT